MDIFIKGFMSCIFSYYLYKRPDIMHEEEDRDRETETKTQRGSDRDKEKEMDHRKRYSLCT